MTGLWLWMLVCGVGILLCLAAVVRMFVSAVRNDHPIRATVVTLLLSLPLLFAAWALAWFMLMPFAMGGPPDNAT